jgi:hypothetical protein
MNRIEKRLRLRRMAAAFVLIAMIACGSAYFLLSPTTGEPFYILSCLFLFMAVFCLFAKHTEEH